MSGDLPDPGPIPAEQVQALWGDFMDVRARGHELQRTLRRGWVDRLTVTRQVHEIENAAVALSDRLSEVNEEVVA